jgi:hypothetical protein
MYRSAVVFAASLWAVTAHADIVSDKSCIFAAAQKLPFIPGMTVIAGRVTELPPELRQKQVGGGSSTRMVEIDVNAAALDATYSFICIANGRITIASPMGIIR